MQNYKERQTGPPDVAYPQNANDKSHPKRAAVWGEEDFDEPVTDQKTEQKFRPVGRQIFQS